MFENQRDEIHYANWQTQIANWLNSNASWPIENANLFQRLTINGTIRIGQLAFLLGQLAFRSNQLAF